MARCMCLNPTDDVAVAVEAVAAGEMASLPDGREVVARDPIPFAHKIALRDIQAGSEIRKYGEVIGAATMNIAAGQHVHVHNLRSLRVQGGGLGQ